MSDFDHKWTILHGHGMDAEHVQSSNWDTEHSVFDIETFSNVHIGFTKVDIPKIIIK